MAFVLDLVNNASAVMRDHRKSIAFIVTAIVLMIVFLTLLRYGIEKNPAVVSQTVQITQKYGLLGGFAIAAIGSLWFLPTPYEIVIAPILKFYQPQFLAVLVIALGAFTADIFNFYSGRKIGEKLVRKRIEPATIKRIEKFLDKYGVLTLVVFGFIAPVTSYDIVSFVMGGFSRMPARIFFPVTFVARILHFIMVLFISNGLLAAAGINLG
ncbi:TPA: VTT domain-containing protein [archaeon]|nr:VTT domain-containing protein [Candidatus Naiadarchaeales archaeon SRR2090153.bin461]